MKKIINLLIFFTCVTSYSQVTLEWVKRYDDTTQGQDNPIKVLTDKQNNVYVTGSFNGYIGTIKYNSSGAQQWVRYYKWQSNPYSDLRAAIIDKDSNLYLAARGGDLFNNRYDCVLIKYNSQGNVVWEKNYGGTGAWSPNALVIDRDKNICVTGTTSYNNLSIFLLKYTPQGDTVWTKLYKFPGYQSNYGEAIAIDSLNNIIISGGAKQTGYSLDGIVIKFSPQGNFLWNNWFNNVSNLSDDLDHIAIDNNNNVICGGLTEQSGTSGDYLIIKYNSSGVQQWVKRYNGGGIGDELKVMQIDGTGNIIVTGNNYTGGGMGTINTVKYNTNGDSLWVKKYSRMANGADDVSDMILDNQNNIYLLGSSIGNGTSYDYLTLKYNSSGVQQWTVFYNGLIGNGEDYGTSITLDNDNNVIVTGGSDKGGFNHDYATVKYSQFTGLITNSIQTPENFTLHQNYPNPFNPTTKITASLGPSQGGKQDVKLIIYNVSGQEIAVFTPPLGGAREGLWEVQWNAENFSGGIYFYQLTVCNEQLTELYKETKKMVLIK